MTTSLASRMALTLAVLGMLGGCGAGRHSDVGDPLDVVPADLDDETSELVTEDAAHCYELSDISVVVDPSNACLGLDNQAACQSTAGCRWYLAYSCSARATRSFCDLEPPGYITTFTETARPPWSKECFFFTSNQHPPNWPSCGEIWQSDGGVCTRIRCESPMIGLKRDTIGD